MEKKFDNGQLKGAYSAGFDAGIKQGAEKMRSEGWRKWKEGDRMPVEHEVVKTLVPTISGWIGLGKIKRVDASGVEVYKLSELTGDPEIDWCKTADLMMHEIALKYSIDA